MEEGPRAKLVNPEILQVLSSMLGSEKDGEREAAAGVLANLTQSSCYSDELVKVGIIPKLVRSCNSSFPSADITVLKYFFFQSNISSVI